MSGSFNPSADAAIVMSAGTAGAAGTGAHTLVALWKSDAVNANGAMAGLYASSTQVRQFLADSGELFGTADFSAGYPLGGVGLDTWYVGAISKPSGSAHYRIHLWPYAAAGTGTMDHGEASDAANHGDGSSITEIRIGLNDVRGNGLIAVIGVWDVVLSDGQLDTLKSANLSTWAALNPKELISLENWNGSTGATAVVGTSTQSSITGTVGVGANPPSFNFALSATPALSGAQQLPPHLLLALAARNQAMWQAGAGITAQASSGASGADQRSQVADSGAKGATGGVSSSVRSSTQPAGGKVAAAGTSAAVRSVDAPAGRKGGVGAASVATRTASTTAGRKSATAAAGVATRINTAPVASPSAATQATVRPATAPAGRKATTGAASAAVRSQILVAGSAGPARSPVVAGRRPLRTQRAPGRIVSSPSSTAIVTSSARRPG